MANSIQAIRHVYDIVRSSRDKDNQFSDDTIQMLLARTVDDEVLIGKYKRFEMGYAAEDLFERIYSLLPWVKLITPLGQEQFPEKSKEEYQVTDYEVLYEVGDKEHTSTVLVEVKLVDGEKQTHEIKKYQLEVLQKYAKEKNVELLFALFWRKHMVWTVVPIEAYDEKSSLYKISFQKAISSDVSAIFGDYTYYFDEPIYRKALFTVKAEMESHYAHYHETYGRTIYDGLSADGDSYEKMMFIEPPLLDCAFDFVEETVRDCGDGKTELIERLCELPYMYRLSSLILSYLLKIFCYDRADMYVKNTDIVKLSFGIVDTVRQKMKGKIYYAIPSDNPTAERLFRGQFGKISWIMAAFNELDRKDGEIVLVPHNNP